MLHSDWTALGLSGKEYDFVDCIANWHVPDYPGVYIFGKKLSGPWIKPLYVGEASNIMDRLRGHEKMPCVQHHRGTHILVRVNRNGVHARRAEEADLRKWLNPPCNKEKVADDWPLDFFRNHNR